MSARVQRNSGQIPTRMFTKVHCRVSNEDESLEPCPSVAGNSLDAWEQTASLPLVVEDFKVAPYSARASVRGSRRGRGEL